MTDQGSQRGMARWWWLALLALVVLGLAGRSIMNRKQEQQQLVAASVSTSGAPLTLAQADLTAVEHVQLQATVPISGSVMAVDRVLIKSRVAGVLTTVSAREGDAVRRGQLLARVDTDEYQSRLEQAQQQAASARAQADIAQRTLDNNRALVAQGFISKNALDTSVSNAAAAKANMQAARAAADVARKALADTQLVSPIDGLVAQQFVQAGERVSPDARVLEVVNLQRMEMETALKPEDVARVKVGAQARLKVDGLTDEVLATVARINPSADAVSRSVTVYLSVPAQAALRHGLYAQGQLQLGQADTLALPTSVIRRGSKGAFVQLLQPKAGQTGGWVVVHRSVQLGATGSTASSPQPLVSVVSGLQAGERVLRGSLGLLRDGTAVQLAATR